jgi:hypothetical protein
MIEWSIYATVMFLLLMFALANLAGRKDVADRD